MAIPLNHGADDPRFTPGITRTSQVKTTHSSAAAASTGTRSAPAIRDDLWRGKTLKSLRFDAHMEAFQNTGNAPSLSHLASSWGQPPEEATHHETPQTRAHGPGARPSHHEALPASQAEIRHLEERETELEKRYERQQDVFGGATKSKTNLKKNLQRGIHLFSTASRNYRGALKDLVRNQKREDPHALHGSVGQVIESSTALAGHVRSLLDMSHKTKEQNAEILLNRDLVGKHEVMPDDLERKREAREALSSRLQSQIANRRKELLDPSHALQVGQYEKEWAEELADTALEMIEEGTERVQAILERSEEEEKARLRNEKATPGGPNEAFFAHMNEASEERQDPAPGSQAPKKPKDLQRPNFRQYEQPLELLKTQRVALKSDTDDLRHEDKLRQTSS